MAKPPVSLRQATTEDEAFLLEVYSSTRADELAQVCWNDSQREAFLKMQFAAQQLHYRKHNPQATHHIILLGSLPIGRLYIARRESEMRILDITILPEYRNQGIGTSLVNQLMQEAAQANKPLNISVESFNQSYNLFQRLGFCQVDGDGINCLMEWRAGSSSSTQPKSAQVPQ